MNVEEQLRRRLEEALPLERDRGDWDDVLERAGVRRFGPRQLLMLAAVVVLLGVPSAYAVGPRLFGLGGGESAREVEVDERRGGLRGVLFGDSALEVLDRLGPPSDDDQGFFPGGREYTGPPAIDIPREDQGTRLPPATLHFEDTAYLASERAGVFAMATLAEGARTRAGVGVGDDLDAVRGAYEGVECGEVRTPGYSPQYAWCRASTGRVHVFFGGDPIASITLITAEP